jgi:hypothetical protein
MNKKEKDVIKSILKELKKRELIEYTLDDFEGLSILLTDKCKKMMTETLDEIEHNNDLRKTAKKAIICIILKTGKCKRERLVDLSNALHEFIFAKTNLSYMEK